jgi:hypothetical protein
MASRQAFFLAAFIQARKRGDWPEKAIRQGIDKVHRVLNMPMSRTEAMRILAPWRRRGMAGAKVMLPEFIDPSMIRPLELQPSFVTWAHRLADPNVDELLSAIARHGRPDAKVIAAIATKIGALPAFPAPTRAASGFRSGFRFGRKKSRSTR